MDLCLYTDSVPDLTLDEALEFAVSVGAGAVEIAAGGQSAAPHMRVFDLVHDRAKRSRFARSISSRGLQLAAINCSAWPMHPVYGEQQLEIMRAAIRLAGELGVDKIVTMSGCPGDSPSSRLVNWITYPWPPEAASVLDEQWKAAFELWHDVAALAAAHGVRRVALELHPLHLAYNVPTLVRLRDEIGPVIGANVDPSHMFWQQMDPIRVIHALGEAVQHVHLKDVELHESEVAVSGVLDARTFADTSRRAWIFRTVGRGHGTAFWGAFLEALRNIGYDDVLSIENEDPLQSAEEGVSEAAAFMRGLLADAGVET